MLSVPAESCGPSIGCQGRVSVLAKLVLISLREALAQCVHVGLDGRDGWQQPLCGRGILQTTGGDQSDHGFMLISASQAPYSTHSAAHCLGRNQKRYPPTAVMCLELKLHSQPFILRFLIGVQGRDRVLECKSNALVKSYLFVVFPSWQPTADHICQPTMDV